MMFFTAPVRRRGAGIMPLTAPVRRRGAGMMSFTAPVRRRGAGVISLSKRVSAWDAWGPGHHGTDPRTVGNARAAPARGAAARAPAARARQILERVAPPPTPITAGGLSCKLRQAYFEPEVSSGRGLPPMGFEPEARGLCVSCPLRVTREPLPLAGDQRGHEHPRDWEQGEHHSNDLRTAKNALPTLPPVA
eukprot:gene10894-biopygen2281